VASIVNSSGAAVVNESFTPFGSRRNPTTWSGAPSTGDLTTAAGISREGYTFQTQLGLWMGLSHMNGRVQDSITGRFLSPDPRIPNRADTQSYNRYAYTNNNPLTLVDPTGFDDKSCPADGGCGGGGGYSYVTPLTGTMIPGYIPDGFSCSGNCSLSSLTGLSQGQIN